MNDHPRHPAKASQTGPILFTNGFRPFFLAAGLWAALALALWITAFASGAAIPSRFDPLTWHIHEMLFGFAMAAVAGFLLTAIPNWTRRLPVNGGPLVLLAGFWLLGRIVTLLSSFVPAWIALVADLSFPVVLIAVVLREIVAGRNWRNLPVVGPVIVLGCANLLMHLDAYGTDIVPGMELGLVTGIGWRLALAAFLTLISVIGGRIVPSFTRNWLAQRGDTVVTAIPNAADHAALLVVAFATLWWAIQPYATIAGGLLLAAALLHLWRLSRWRGIATTAEPLLVILHVGYGWLVLGLGLLGLSILGPAIPALPAIPESAAIHALTAGAIGTMILAVMTRAILGHTGRALTASGVTTLLYVMVTLAAATRVGAAWSEDWMMPALELSALLWIGAYGGFALVYGPMLVKPRKTKG
jgi:uncharacterized protein involved in response to NO